jgi:hypothetical protein
MILKYNNIFLLDELFSIERMNKNIMKVFVKILALDISVFVLKRVKHLYEARHLKSIPEIEMLKWV